MYVSLLKTTNVVTLGSGYVATVTTNKRLAYIDASLYLTENISVCIVEKSSCCLRK